MKLFSVPITHDYIQNLTTFDLEFIEMSTALDNPKLRDKILNTVYDEEFDEYAEEIDNEELTDEERKIMEEIMSKQGHKTEAEEDEKFTPLGEDKENSDLDDWEEVD